MTKRKTNRRYNPLPTNPEERERLGEQLARRYKAGETLDELAHTLPHSTTSVRTLLLERGVELRARGGRRGGRPQLSTG